MSIFASLVVKVVILIIGNIVVVVVISGAVTLDILKIISEFDPALRVSRLGFV